MAFSTVLSLPPTSEALKFVGIERERHGSWRSTESKRVDEEARGGERAENNIETPAAGAAAEVALMGDFEIFEKCSQFRYVRVCVCVCVCVCVIERNPLHYFTPYRSVGYSRLLARPFNNMVITYCRCGCDFITGVA